MSRNKGLTQGIILEDQTTIHPRSCASQDLANTHNCRQQGARIRWPFVRCKPWVPVVLFFSWYCMAAFGQVSPKAPTAMHPEIPAHSREMRPEVRILQQGLSLLPPNEAQKEYSRFTVKNISQREAESLFALTVAAFFDADSQEMGGLSQGPISALLEMIKVPGEELSTSSLMQRTILVDRQKVEDFLAEASQRMAYERPSGMKGVVLKVPSVVAAPDNLSRPSAGPPSSSPETSILSEGFESGSWGRWTISDDSFGAYTWTRTTCDKHAGSYSADAVRGGFSGPSLACSAAYPNYIQNWLTDGQCENFQGASQAWLDYYFTLNCEGTFYDYLAVYFYGEGQYWGWAYSGSLLPWFHFVGNLRQWYHLGDLTTGSCNTLAFLFHSDSYTAPGFGARIDDISISTGALGALTCTISATPSSGQAPLAVQFDSTVTGASIFASYLWIFGDGTTSTEQNPSHTYATMGKFDPSLLVRDGTTHAVANTHVSVIASENDACAGARTVSANSFAETFSNGGYTLEAGEPSPCGSIGATAWYKFTPSQSGSADISLCGSSFDTVLAVYSGSCGSLINIACNDDSCSQQSSLSGIGMNAGTTYYIQIGGYTGATGTVVLDFGFTTRSTCDLLYGVELVPWGSNLLIISQQNGSGTVVGNTGIGEIFGLAFTPDGRLFGIAQDQLLLIDSNTAQVSSVGSGLGISGINALVSDSNGHLYGATSDGAFVGINPETGVAVVIGWYGADLVSSGDLAFAPNGTLYATSQGGDSDRLIRVNPQTGQATVVGSIGFQQVYGLAFNSQGILLAGANGAMLDPTLIVVNTTTGAGSAIGSITNANGLGDLALRDCPASCTLSCTATVPSAGQVTANVSFQATATPSDVCTGTTAYSWTFGDGGSSTQQNPTHAYTITGVFDWTMTASLPSGEVCQDTGNITITVAPLPSLTVTIISPAVESVAGMVSLKAHVTLPAGTALQSLSYTIGSDVLWSGTSNDYSYPWDTTSVSLNAPAGWQARRSFTATATASNGQTGQATVTLLVKPRLSGRLIIRDPLTLRSWNLDKIADASATVSVNLSGGLSIVMRVVSDGTFNSRNVTSGNENDLPSGTAIHADCSLDYTDFIDVDNSSILGGGCAPPTGNMRTRHLNRPLELGVLYSGVPNSGLLGTLPPPIFMHHGIRSCWESAWSDWADYLTGKGYIVFTPNHVFLGTRQLPNLEAEDLARQVTMDMNGLFTSMPDYYFICHSQGGVAARFFVTYQPTLASKLLGIFTLGTPHSGTDFPGAGLYFLDKNQMTVVVNAFFPSFLTTPVYAIGGHTLGCLSQGDGIVWLFPPLATGISPFRITIGTGILYWTSQNFQGYNPWVWNWPDAHNACFMHTNLTGSSAEADILDYKILPVMRGDLPYRPAATNSQPLTLANEASPQLLLDRILQPHAEASEVFTIPVQGTDLLFVDSMPLGGTTTVSLQDPEGLQVGPQSQPAYPGLDYANDELGEHWNVANPKRGNWLISVTTITTPGTIALGARQNSVWGITGRTSVSVCNPLDAILVSSQGQGDLSGISITQMAGKVSTREGSEVGSLQLFDDGLHRDGGAGDGVFANQLAAPLSPGDYEIRIHAEGLFGTVQVQREARIGLIVSPTAPVFSGSFQATPYDSNSDGIMDQLLLATGLNLPEAGTYTLAGDLQDSSGYLVGHAVTTNTASSPGLSQFSLAFDMTGLGCGQFSGPFCAVNLMALQEGSLLGRYGSPMCSGTLNGTLFGCDPTKSAVPLIVAVSPQGGFPGEMKGISISGTGFKSGAQVTLGGGLSASGVEVPASGAINLNVSVPSGATPGPNSITVTNTDGRSATLDPGFWVLTDQPPFVTITYPGDRQVVSGQLTMSAAASDDRGVSRVEFYIDGLLVSAVTTFPYQAAFDTTTIVNGSHTLKAEAWDTVLQHSEYSSTVNINNPCMVQCSATAVAVGGAHPFDVSFTGSATSSLACTGPVAFDWNFGDGTAHSTSQNPSHTYASAGTYNWSLTIAINGVNCQHSGSITVSNPVAPPVISLMKKVTPPFTVVVTGSNLQSGIKVYIGTTQWSSVLWKNTGKIKLTGGASLKTAVPRGTIKTFRFVNPDGGETTITWGW